MMMGFLDGLLARENEKQRLDELEEHLNSAKIQGKEKCVRSGYCCYKKPCIPTPDEIVSIAQHLKLDINDFINRYCVIDVMPNSKKINTYHLTLAGINTQKYAGKFLTGKQTFNQGHCVFYSEEGKFCQLHESGTKPRTGKEFDCTQLGDSFCPIDSWNENQLLSRFKIDGRKLENETDNFYDDEDDYNYDS